MIFLDILLNRNSIAALGENSTTSSAKTVTQNKEEESTVDGAIRLNQNRRQREEKWDQDDLESSGIPISIVLFKFDL
jgi:hypothetical protein